MTVTRGPARPAEVLMLAPSAPAQSLQGRHRAVWLQSTQSICSAKKGSPRPLKRAGPLLKDLRVGAPPLTP